MHKEVEQLSITERILASLENPAISVQTIQTPLRQQLKERIYTELYKLDAQEHLKTLEKPLKNTLVSRTFVDYLLNKSHTQFIEFPIIHQALRELLQTQNISDYVRDTIYYCYDQILALQYANLYQPLSETPRRFSTFSELYSAQWPIDTTQHFSGTMEIIRYPSITLPQLLPVAHSILKIMDEISAGAADYVPLTIDYIKKHFLDVDYLVVFRNETHKVIGVTIGLNRATGDYPSFLCAPGILRTKNDKNGLGTILGAMIAKGSVAFGKQDLVIAGFTQNKRVMDFMKMCHPDLEQVFISGLHWSKLSETEKKKIDMVIRAYSGKSSIESSGYMLNAAGIAENRYPVGHKADVHPAPIKGIPLGPNDAVFMMNTVPKNIQEIIQKHTPQTRYKNRFFGEFVKTLCLIESFEKIA